MDGTIIFALGLVVFFAAHLFAAFRRRGPGDLPERLGVLPYRGLFSLVSIAGLVLIVIGYGELRNLYPVWSPPDWTRHIPLLVMAPAMVLFVAAEAPAGRIKRLAKHPMLFGVKLWAAAHLVANGDLASIILFGAFLAFAVLDRIVVKRRATAASAPAAVSAKGDAIALVGGLALYFAIVFFLHEAVIGVPVVY